MLLNPITNLVTTNCAICIKTIFEIKVEDRHSLKANLIKLKFFYVLCEKPVYYKY